MSNRTFANLEWLPKPDGDFASRCQAAVDLGAAVGRELQLLATSALDHNQLVRLAGTIEKLRAKGADFKPLVPFRLGLLSNATTDFIVPALVATAARHGIILEVVTGGYDQVLQGAVSPDSHVNRSAPDAVLLAIDYRGIPARRARGNAEKGQEAVDASLGYLQAVREGIKRNSKAICILQTVSSPPETLFGNMDGVHPGSLRRIIDGVNSGICESVRGSSDVVIDIAHLASTIGLADWHSPREWNMAKIPFSDAFIPLYADHVSRTLAALRGKSRRCLILDLDNTLWGGVIGDDGLEHIKIGQGDPTGEAYLSVQQLALDLRARGIVLAVCSKNEDEIARSPFQKHTEMLLKEGHIAVFQANWRDKATNIKAIAEELSLGLDAFVFLDDNPSERLLIRQTLPEVAVPELPADPALYSRTLAAAGYFEAVAFSEDDLRRADFYQDNARRVSLQNQAGDLESYLASLAMEITFQPFDQTGRARIAQLINKSNQFNLTTKRYTEAQVAAMQDDPAYFTLQIRLSDTFGDNGMISVIICRRATKEAWEIDTWLMSCRVLGRRVENMALLAILEQAKKEGVRKLIGTYVPTDRNKLVQEHYAKLGFQVVQTENGISTYELDVNSAVVQGAPMTVKHIEADRTEPGSKNASPVTGPAQEAFVCASSQPQPQQGVEPSNEVEAELLRIWKEVLDRDKISVQDDFFEVGGDSLHAVRLMFEIEKTFGQPFDISTLMSHPTIEAFGKLLRPVKAAVSVQPSQQKSHGTGNGNGNQRIHAGPSNEVEAELLRIWKEVLDRDTISVQDDFFEVGGDSLHAVRLMFEIEKTFRQQFDISTLMSRPTIEAFGQILKPLKDDATPPVHIVPMRPRGDRTPLFCIHCGTGHVLRYRALSSYLDPEIPLYGVRAPELRAGKTLPTIEELAALYVKDIRKVRPHGPYQLFGFCIGGIVAFEVARQLTQLGETVSRVVMVETLNYAYYNNASFLQSLRFHSRYAYGRFSKYSQKFVKGEWKDMYAGVQSLIDWQKRKRNASSPQSAQSATGARDIYNDIAVITTIANVFEPKPYAGKIHLIRAETQKAEFQDDMTMGWQDLARDGVEVSTLPGTHFSLLEKPDVARVAETLDSLLLQNTESEVSKT
jgi:FkbH-like protein